MQGFAQRPDELRSAVQVLPHRVQHGVLQTKGLSGYTVRLGVSCQCTPWRTYFYPMTPTVLRLRELREKAGLTQEQLAELVDVRRATISDLERGESGRITLELIDRLAAVLGVE